MTPYRNSLLTINQVYLGYDIDDLLRLVRYRAHDSVAPTPGTYTDYFGIKTRLSYFTDQPSNHDQLKNRDKVRAGFPFPDDGLHAEAIEYLGTCKALEGTHGSNVTIVELGAGYAPWLVFSAHVARRLGKEKVQLIAVEAEAERLALIEHHFNDNGIPLPGSDGAITTRIIHGAISDSKGAATFGSVSIHDWGGAVQDIGHGDYRGMEVRQVAVPAMPIHDVLDELSVVDLLHVDIQGWEARAIRASLNTICSRVRYMVIGTHSRAIEGELLSMLRERGWKLMHEKPCQFNCRLDTEELAGATHVDGTQVWANGAMGMSTCPAVLLDSVDARVAEQVRRDLESGRGLHPADDEDTQAAINLTELPAGWSVASRVRKMLAAMRA